MPRPWLRRAPSTAGAPSSSIAAPAARVATLAGAIAMTACGVAAREPSRAAERETAPRPVSRHVDVLGSTMHYVEAGEGPPILLLHGQPTSSFLWRRVIPGLAGAGRVIAPDLIGFGDSDRPDIAYDAEDHTRYLSGFIEALDLDQVVIVGHDWGSYLGAQYAIDHRERIRGLVFLEAIFAAAGGLRPQEGEGELVRRAGETLRLIGQAARADVETIRQLVQEDNAFIERFLPLGTMRRLTEIEMDAYRAPFRDPSRRQPMAQWPRQIPREAVGTEILRYTAALEEWPVPKLLLTVEPGVLVPRSVVDWARASLPELTIVDLGLGLHFVQEDHPEEIAAAILAWMEADLPQSRSARSRL